LIEVAGVTRAYGQEYVLTDVSLSVAGAAAVLGRKSAGKTTLADIITGCVYPETGSVSIFGIDMSRRPAEAKRALGYMPQQLALCPEMTPADYLGFVCSLRGIRGSGAKKAADEAIEKAGIPSLSCREIKGLSRFEQKRLSLAGALCGGPHALVLDEPSDGLLPEQAFKIRETIKSLRGDHMIMLFTRSIREAADVCESVAVLKGGSITARETIQDLLKTAERQRRITVRLKCERQKGLAVLDRVEGVEYAEVTGGEGGACDYLIEALRDVREDIFRAVVKEDIVMLGMGCVSVTLDDIYAGLTGGALE
jgi:ABC-2 type transport system ATP-binding protein